MQKTKNIIIALLTVGIIVSTSGATFADTTPPPLPAADSPFWKLISNLKRPDSPDCISVVTAEMTAQGIPADQVPVDQICSGMSQIPNNMKSSMTADGTTTNIFDQSDWHNVTNLYFEHSVNGVPMGKIEFTKPIDFMSYDFMTFFTNFGNEMSMGKGLIGLDASVVGGLKNYGAVLTMYNLPNFSNPTILVNGKKDASRVVSNIIYDKTNHTITFDAAHFTTFKVVEKKTKKHLTSRPRIDSVKAMQYTDGNGRVKIEFLIKGKHINKHARVSIDGKYSLHRRYKGSHEILGYFYLSDLQKLDTNHMYLKVTNRNGKSKMFPNLVDLSSITKAAGKISL